MCNRNEISLNSNCQFVFISSCQTVEINNEYTVRDGEGKRNRLQKHNTKCTWLIVTCTRKKKTINNLFFRCMHWTKRTPNGSFIRNLPVFFSVHLIHFPSRHLLRQWHLLDTKYTVCNSTLCSKFFVTTSLTIIHSVSFRCSSFNNQNPEYTMLQFPFIKLFDNVLFALASLKQSGKYEFVTALSSKSTRCRARWFCYEI